MPPFTNDPKVAAYLAGLEDKNQRMAEQFGALHRAYRKMASEFQDNKLELRKLADALAKAAKRIRYIEDIPGKRVPYFLNFNVEIPGAATPGTQVAASIQPATQSVSQDGPFVCTTYLSAFMMKTYSLGPYGTSNPADGRPGDPPAGAEVISPFTGRFRPVASTADAFEGAYIGPGTGGWPAATTVAGALAVKTFRPGTIDFLFEIFDAASDRNRQNNIPTPSRYIFTENDRPLYLPISDFFPQSAVLQFKPTLTRELGYVEVNWGALPNGFGEGSSNPPPDPTQPNAVGRQVLAVGGTLTFTMLGYKILNAQSPAT